MSMEVTDLVAYSSMAEFTGKESPEKSVSDKTASSHDLYVGLVYATLRSKSIYFCVATP